MRLLKSNKLLSIVNSYMVDSPQPSNLSYAWNFGSLLATCLGIQIITGIILAIHYTPNVDLAFVSVEHIMRDVNYGWIIRYIHANTASFFFIFVYLHIGRGLYYGSYRSPRVLPWSIGVIILVLIIATRFLGYVLPYGQMSLWGATVITNMLSAIPWIGKDFVELNSLIALLLLRCFFIFFVIPTIGVVKPQSFRKGRKARTDSDKNDFKDISYRFLSIFIGFVDGDGYIQVISDLKGNVKISLSINLHIKDLALLEYFRSVLKIGTISLSHKYNIARWTVCRTDLQEVLFPLILYHGLFFLTNNRRRQFDKAILVLTNNITRFDDIPAEVPVLYPLPVSPIGYVLLPFFLNWIVGFTIAEGSFFIKTSGDFFFSLKQKNLFILFSAFLLIFETKRKISVNKGNSQFRISSVIDLTKVVKFFSFSNLHPLKGLKRVQYKNWILKIKNVKRFNKIKLPF